MSMAATATASASASANTSTAATMGHDMGDMGGGCKISMLWNWDTIDTCFISSSWHIRSSGMFAGSCIGVVLLVVSLELLRRTVKEYDRFLMRKHTAAARLQQKDSSALPGPPGNNLLPDNAVVTCSGSGSYRPTILEQATRSLLHMVQFAVAYFIMLLAMYYNGYIIICIFIGAYLGAFVFQWETLGVGLQTSAAKEATVCCG
ncbi:putative high affinity copper protein [Apodospora peruviana]|uniref:Copper transport protein n=1 Tax=Apodospora peruviana TaxID=516989 RepID=A0AAE0HXY6_9PEZI|nr:putative high affinity copper protein [Apodospora peruviana]